MTRFETYCLLAIVAVGLFVAAVPADANEYDILTIDESVCIDDGYANDDVPPCDEATEETLDDLQDEE